jgi:hypothetical protein
MTYKAKNKKYSERRNETDMKEYKEKRQLK